MSDQPLDPIAHESKRMMALMAKRMEFAMFDFKPGKRVVRTYVERHWYGSIVKHEVIDFRLDVVENPVLRTKTSKTGVYRWIAP